MVTFLIAPGCKWRKQDPNLEALTGTLFAVKSLVWLQWCCGTSAARRTLALMDQNCQEAILFGDLVKVEQLVSWVKNCMSPDRFPTLFGMCSWFGRGFHYIGIAGMTRISCPNVSGLICRLFEHLTLRARSCSTHANLHRYRLARRIPLHSLMWLPVHTGHECAIRARECLAIKMYKPNANNVKCIRQAVQAKKSPRKRPPPWRRQPTSMPCVNETWSQHSVAQQLDKALVKMLDHQLPLPAQPVMPDSWALSFFLMHTVECSNNCWSPPANLAQLTSIHLSTDGLWFCGLELEVPLLTGTSCVLRGNNPFLVRNFLS